MGFNNKIEILLKKCKSLEKEKNDLESQLDTHNKKWESLFKEKESEVEMLQNKNKEDSLKTDIKWKQQFGHVDQIVNENKIIKNEVKHRKEKYTSLEKENKKLIIDNDSLQKLVKKKEEVETLLLDVNELEFLLGQLSKTNFVGSDVQTVFQTMYKLQERYKLLSPNKNNS